MSPFARTLIILSAFACTTNSAQAEAIGVAAREKSCVAVYSGFTETGPDFSTGDDYIGITDGTMLGTRKIADAWPGVRSGSFTNRPKHITAVGGSKAVFTAESPVSGVELYVTDGTRTGTRLLKDIVPGLGSSSPRPLSGSSGPFDRVGKWLLFTTGVDLWRSDGTTAGTVQVFNSDYPDRLRSWEVQANGGTTVASLIPRGIGHRYDLDLIRFTFQHAKTV